MQHFCCNRNIDGYWTLSVAAFFVVIRKKRNTRHNITKGLAAVIFIATPVAFNVTERIYTVFIDLFSTI